MRVSRLRMSDETAELVRTLHPNIKRKVKTALQTILNNPSSGKALKGELKGLQGFKVGRLRVIYRAVTDRGITEVVAIGPRKTIYEITLRFLKNGE